MADDDNELDRLVSIAQDGIEVEAFFTTKVGRMVKTAARLDMRNAIAIILDPNNDTDTCWKAVLELRVQHRMLDQLTRHVRRGQQAERQISMAESPMPPDLTDDDDGEPV